VYNNKRKCIGGVMVKYEEIIKELIEKNKGIITSTEVTESGIPRYYLTHMVKKGEIVRVENGIYSLPNTWEDELYFLQYKLTKGIFSNETALYIHNLTDRTPSKYTMTFPSGYNTKHLKNKDINIKLSNKETYDIGIITMDSFNDNPIRVYDIERTLCDILISRNKTDIQIINQAMKTYAQSNNKNISKLLDYAERLHVKSKVSKYMEILL
jgi:predicted transcriptional regulator of viral defense system